MQAGPGPLLLALLCLSVGAGAYESGSTGADGAFNPAASINVPLPANGVFNFTEVNIPADVVVTFTRNPANTPVRILVTGDVVIDGAISVSGGVGGSSLGGGAGGAGGPGGFDGGAGGIFSSSGASQGSNGMGPGGGRGAPNAVSSFAEAGAGSFASGGRNGTVSGTQGAAGPTYGNAELIPLIGGSGGGGGRGNALRGSGGGGGGGALLIAAGGTVTVNGSALANGAERGSSRDSGNNTRAGLGGGGSGGAIRIIATTVAGEGTISAVGAASAGNGRIRIEAEQLLRIAATSPGFSFAGPSPAFLANTPSIRIASVGGVVAPAVPSGFRDVVLSGVTTNPVTVAIETSGVPVGTPVTLIATPLFGASVSVTSTGVTGSEASGSDSVSIDLPNGNSVLSAQATFTITSASLGDVFAPYADGERVEQIDLAYVPGAGQTTTYITATGRRVSWVGNQRVN